MDAEQDRLYGEQVRGWLRQLEENPPGWDEDAAEIPVDYPIVVNMEDYHVDGLFSIDSGTRRYRFTMPRIDVGVRVAKVKAHMNRMMRAIEEQVEDTRHHYLDEALPPLDDPGAPTVWGVNAWSYLMGVVGQLYATHHGDLFNAMIHTKLGTMLQAHCTGLPSTLPWDLSIGVGVGTQSVQLADSPGITVEFSHYTLSIRTTVFTVCPFVLHETGGKQSHTQRTHIDVTITATAPIQFAAIQREICTHLVPVMSTMKIPDEVVQVAKAYAGPTFTEDAAVRVIKMMRGVTHELVPHGKVINCQVEVVSEDSHLAHDIVTKIEDTLA